MVAGVDDLRAQLSGSSMEQFDARGLAMQRRLRRWLRAGVIPTLGLVTLACERGGVAVARASTSDATAADTGRRALARRDSIVRASPSYIVDSILPIDEELRRFQAGVGPAPDSFAYGASSRDGLVAAFVTAIERNDTTALARLVVNRREFAFLVYPTSPNVRPPYRQAPQLVWLQRSAVTNKSAARILERFGGRPLGFVGYQCAVAPTEQGENTLWDGCVVNRRLADASSSLRMFGPIIERGGRFKFLALSTGL